MERYKYIGTIVLLTIGTIPFIGFLVVANLAHSRSEADLARADRCVNWAHKTHDAQLADGPEVGGSCDLYFRVRSDKDADEDDRRWGARTGH